MKRIILALCAAVLAVTAQAQTALKKVYNEEINPLEQIDQAIGKAKAEGKFVVCQVGETGALGACVLLTSFPKIQL